MPALPVVLTSHDMPAAELGGMRLDGEVFALADGWCVVDELEGPVHRAAALRGGRSPRLIAELGSAAWVWGVTATLPEVAEFCVGLDARARVRDPLIRVRELVLDPEDWVPLGDGAVTSPMRTAVDLARFRDELSGDEGASIVALSRLGGFGLDECVALLNRRRNLPLKRLAVARLRELLNQPALTR